MTLKLKEILRFQIQLKWTEYIEFYIYLFLTLEQGQDINSSKTKFLLYLKVKISTFCGLNRLDMQVISLNGSINSVNSSEA